MIARFLASGIVATIALSTFAAATRIHDLGDFSGKKSRKGGTNQSLRHRELKSKSSKSTHPVCLSFGEVAEIKGTDVVQTGPPDDSKPECALGAQWDSDTCVHYAEPFMINRDVGDSTTFVFDDGTVYSFGATSETEPPLGDGALCGSVGTTSGDKLILEYFGDLTNPLDVTTGYDLQNLPLNKLESMKYSFWVESCPTGLFAPPCANEFYLNVYARKSATSDGPWYDCRFDFVPTQGGEVHTWTTFDLSNIKNIAPSRAFPNKDSTCHDATTIQEYIDAVTRIDGAEAVLGNKAFYTFAFNIGDSEAPDAGVSGCYDALHIKLSDEEATRVYDFE